MTPRKRANPPVDTGEVPGFRALTYPGRDLLAMKLGLSALVESVLDIDKANGSALDWEAITELTRALSKFAEVHKPTPRRFDVMVACIGIVVSAFDAIEDDSKDPIAIIEHKEEP